MFIDENRASSLAKTLNVYDYVIVDTCSLMEDCFPAWMDILVNAKEYLKEETHIIIYPQCIEELEKHSKDKSNDSRRIAAKRALKILKAVRRKKIIEFPKASKEENFADNVIYVNVSKHRIHNRVLVITQDRNLADDLNKLNNLGSQLGRKVVILKLIEGGEMVLNKGLRNDTRNNQSTYEKRNTPKPVVKTEKPAVKPVVRQEKKPENDLLTQIKAQDQKLRANLNNPTYPAERKKTDVETQLSLLRKLSTQQKGTLKLLVDEKTLLEAKAKQEANANPQPKSLPKPQPKPVVVKEEKAPSPTPAVTKKEPYGLGKTIEISLKDISERRGFLYRDPSIPYLKNVHGPLDLVSDDFGKILAKLSALQDSNGSIVHKGATFNLSYSDRGYRITVNLDSEKKEEVKVDALPPLQPKVFPPRPGEPMPKIKGTMPAPTPEKPKPKKETPKKDAPKTEEAPKAKRAPRKATLIVAAPEEEKPTKAKPSKIAVNKEERKPAPVKTEAKPAPKAKKAATPKAEPKKETPKAEPKKAAPKAKKEPKENPPAKEKAPAKKATPNATKAKPEAKEPKKEAAKPAPKKESKAKKPDSKAALFEEAKKAEAKLQSTLSNSTYLNESKLKDLQDQLARVQKLSPEQAKSLKFNADSLRSMIGMLK